MPARHRTARRTPNPVDDLRGASRLVIEATKSVADVVEAMHLTIASGPALLGRPLERPARALTGPVYAGLRGVTRLVGTGIDAVLAGLAPLVTPLFVERAPRSSARRCSRS